MERVEDLCLDCGHCCNGNIFPTFRVEKSKWKYFKNLSESKYSSNDDIKDAKQSCEHLIGCNNLCKIYGDLPNEDNRLTMTEARGLIKDLHDDPTNKKVLAQFKSRAKRSATGSFRELRRKGFRV
mgnify:CR=1 FL=1